MTDTTSGAQMVTALVRLRAALQGAVLPLELPGVEAHRLARTEMVDQLEDYVIPRIVTLEAPLLAVVGGSTGAGKSTLVNSLVGAVVTESGVLRPTTRSPVLVHNPADADWFGADRLLPELERVHHPTHDPQALQLVPLDVVPQGLAILDAPDIDSVEESNRRLAAQLLAAADLWLFVTSAARYADQVPWDFLRQAAERSAAVAIVLDRTPADAVGTVASHLARMLAARGLKDSPLFTVNEAPLDAAGLLRPREVVEIRQWLTELGADAAARDAMVKQTIEGAIRSLTRRAHTVADACLEQATAVERLRDSADAAYDEEIRKLLEASRRRHPPARRGDGALAGVRRHRRAAEEPRGQGGQVPRPDGARDQGQAGAGRAGQRRRRVEPRDPDRRARRGRRRAGRGVVGEPRARPRPALRRRRGPRSSQPWAAAQG